MPAPTGLIVTFRSEKQFRIPNSEFRIKKISALKNNSEFRIPHSELKYLRS